MVGFARTLVELRRSAASWLLVTTAMLLGCSDSVPDAVVPSETFVAAAQLAMTTQASSDIGRAVDRFELLGDTATDDDVVALGELVRRIEGVMPIEAIRLRLLLAARPIADTDLAAETARALGHAGLVHAAQSAAAHTAGSLGGTGDEDEPKLSDRIAEREAIGATLQLPTRSPAAKRLLDILTQSPYGDPNVSFWATEAAEATEEGHDPAQLCQATQFANSQLLGGEADAAQRYRWKSEMFDTTRRPFLEERKPGSFDFDVMGLTIAGRLAHVPLCSPGAEGPTALAPVLKRIGVSGVVIQELCVGVTAAAVVQDRLFQRVILLSPVKKSVEALISTEMDSASLRRLRGPVGQPVLLVGNVGGARGYLSSVVLDPASRLQLLAASMLMFGDVSAFAFQQPQSDSLWFNFAVAEGREGCGQCPRYRKVVRLDGVDDGYRIAGEICSAQEVPSATSGVMSSNAVVTVLSGDDKLGLGISDYSRFIERERKAGKSPPEFVSRVIDNFLEITDHLQGARDFVGLERRSIELETALAKVPAFEPELLDSASRAAARLTRMDAAYFRGDFDRAIQIGEQSIGEPYSIAVPRIRLDFANRLSTFYLAQQNYRAAFVHLELTQELDKTGLPAVPGNMAWYSILASDFRSAERFAVRAMEAAVQNGGRVGINAGFMAIARARTGHLLEGLDWLVFGSSVAAQTGNHADRAMILLTASRLAVDANEPKIGLALLEQAMVYMDEVAWRTEGANYALLHARHKLSLGNENDARILAQWAVQLTGGRPTSAHAEALTLLSRIASGAGDLPEALRLAREGFHASIDVATNWQGEGFRLSSAEAAREAADWYLTLLARDQKSTADVVFDALARWKAHVLRDGLARRQGAMPVDAPISAATLASSLAEDEAYIDYFIGEQAAFALVLHRGHVKIIRLPETAATVHDLVLLVQSEMDVTQAVVRDRIGRHRVSPSLEAALKRLHAALLAPLDLPAAVRRLDIAPDSAVGSVPWSALLDSTGKYVGQGASVLVVPGAYFMAQPAACSGERCAKRTMVAGVGRTAPTVATTEDGSPITLPSLRYGRAELRQLSGLWGDRWLELSDRESAASSLPQSQVLTWLGQNAPRMQALHLVGHGTFDRNDPIRSRLYIDPSPTSPFVTAAQIAELSFDGLPLVMIGACESGALQSQGGGEPLGLVRAFLAGGAERVVASQWLVDDRATLMLTTKLHDKLKTRPTSGDTFFEAQREIARRYPHPYFWAAFQMYGRPER